MWAAPARDRADATRGRNHSGSDFCYDGLGRVGGEVFLVGLPEVELPSALQAAERLRHASSQGRGPTSILIASAGRSQLFDD